MQHKNQQIISEYSLLSSLESSLSIYGVFQNRVETNGMTIAHSSTNAFPTSPTILSDLFLVFKAVISPIIGNAMARIITDFENRSPLKNQIVYTAKEIKKAAIDITPDFIIYISLLRTQPRHSPYLYYQNLSVIKALYSLILKLYRNRKEY